MQYSISMRIAELVEKRLAQECSPSPSENPRRGVRVRERGERGEACRIGGREERAGPATLLIASAHALRRLFAISAADRSALGKIRAPGRFEEAAEP